MSRAEAGPPSGRSRPHPYGRVFAGAYLLGTGALWTGLAGLLVSDAAGHDGPPAWAVVLFAAGAVAQWCLTWPLRRSRPEIEEASSPYVRAWYRLVLGIELPTAVRALAATRPPRTHGAAAD